MGTAVEDGSATVSMVLVRHGFSQANAAKIYSGLSDVDLTDQGRDEVRDLRARGIYPATELHFSSPLRRCLQTFEVAYGPQERLDGTIDAFHEVDLGSLEGRGLPPQDAMRLWDSWVSGGGFSAGFGMEAFAHARDRGAGAVRRLASRCAAQGVRTVTVVTHSAIMRAALMGLAGLPQDGWGSLWVPNGLGYLLSLQVGPSAAGAAGAGEEDEAAGLRPVSFLRADPLAPDAVPGGIRAVLPGGVASLG